MCTVKTGGEQASVGELGKQEAGGVSSAGLPPRSCPALPGGDLSPAVSRLPPGLSAPDWSSPTVAAYGAGIKRGEGGSAHSSLDGGLSGLLSKDIRFSAETPGTWPAQICSMRTRRCAMVARKLSTFREEQTTAVRGAGPVAMLSAEAQAWLGARGRGT